MATLNFRSGDTFQRNFIWKDSDENPIDLSGYVIFFRVIIEGVTSEYFEGDGLVVTAEDGLIAVDVPYSDTSDWTADGRWELEVTSYDAVRTTVDGRMVKK